MYPRVGCSSHLPFSCNWHKVLDGPCTRHPPTPYWHSSSPIMWPLQQCVDFHCTLCNFINIKLYMQAFMEIANRVGYALGRSVGGVLYGVRRYDGVYSCKITGCLSLLYTCIDWRIYTAIHHYRCDYSPLCSTHYGFVKTRR